MTTANSDPSSMEQPARSISADSGEFPLAAAQLRMWHAQSAHPKDSSYNGSFRMNLAGPVDPAILQATLREIIRRHEILRAEIFLKDGKPFQRIRPDQPLALAQKDLRSVPGTDRETELDRICLEDAQTPFDLTRGPLFRLGLVRMEDQRYVLTLTLHQIIADGWSIGLFMEELQTLYPAVAEKRVASVPPPAASFREHVLAQHSSLQSERILSQLDYWKKKLRGLRCLRIAPDLPSPPAFSSKSQIISHLLPRDLTDKLRDFSTAQGSTFFITTLAAFFAFLYRYTGEEDLSVGSPLAGRNSADVESIIGQYVNHIVFRLDAAGDPAFPDFAARVRDSVWEAFANQDVPFEEVQRAVLPHSDPLADPLYVVNFVCQREYGRASKFNFDFSGIRMSTMPSKSQGALYDLNFFLVEREAGWRLSLEYRSELFSPTAAKQFLDHFKDLLESLALNPQLHLSNLKFSGDSPYLREADSRISARAAGTLASDDTYALPASVVQQRFWLLAQLDPSNSAFHMAARLHIAGPLDVPALTEAFNALLRRHESLRTTFEEIDDELAQVIAPAKNFALPVTDLSHLSPSQLPDLIRQETSAPFDLTRGPLFRAHLFRAAATNHTLVTTLHHILSDGWSQRVLQDDLWSLYTAFHERRAPALASLPIQYGDFTAWQRDWLASSEAAAHLQFWLDKLSGTLPVLNFPTDRPATGRPASHGALETLLLPRDLSDSIKSFAQSNSVTPFVVLLTAFASILSRRANAQDLIVGSPVANRREETEHLIGPFSGPVALRIDLSGNPQWKELLSRVRDTTFEALSHTDLPFETLLENLRIPSSGMRKPLFQFYFYFQTAFLQPRQLAGLTITPLPTVSTGSPFELQLSVIERQEGMRAELEYNPDLFDSATAQGIILEIERTLRTLTTHPASRLNDPLA